MNIRAIVGFMMLLAVGCGSGTATLSGNVTVDGQPLTSGTVIVQDSTGEVRLASVTEGTFSLDGVPYGQVKIAVVAGVTGPEQIGPSRKHGQFGRGRAQREKPVALIPDEWQQLETSPQTVQVDHAKVWIEVLVPRA